MLPPLKGKKRFLSLISCSVLLNQLCKILIVAPFTSLLFLSRLRFVVTNMILTTVEKVFIVDNYFRSYGSKIAGGLSHTLLYVFKNIFTITGLVMLWSLVLLNIFENQKAFWQSGIAIQITQLFKVGTNENHGSENLWNNRNITTGLRSMEQPIFETFVYFNLPCQNVIKCKRLRSGVGFFPPSPPTC